MRGPRQPGKLRGINLVDRVSCHSGFLLSGGGAERPWSGGRCLELGRVKLRGQLRGHDSKHCALSTERDLNSCFQVSSLSRAGLLRKYYQGRLAHEHNVTGQHCSERNYAVHRPQPAERLGLARYRSGL